MTLPLNRFPFQGAGLGLKREMLQPLADSENLPLEFLEVAPENWIHVGGRLGKQFRALTEKYRFSCHGLSLSIGSPSVLDLTLVREIKNFLKTHEIEVYSEHLSYCSDSGHLYDLMPIPFTEEAVKYVAERVKVVQDILERPLILENVSYYATPCHDLTEIEFFNAVVEESDCQVLLDVNNVYVNAINHRYDPKAFIDAVCPSKVAYLHIAGHFDEAEDLKVDTHGADVKEDVWELLKYTYNQLGVIPTLLERDFNIPPLEVLLQEVERINNLQKEARERHILENQENSGCQQPLAI